MKKSKPLIIVIAGTSGAGKDSVIHAMRERGIPFKFVVTAASRAPRPGEVHGVDYLFVSKEEFERMIRDDELLEYSTVYGEYKGVPRKHVEDALASGLDVVLRVDVQGAEKIRSKLPEAVLIFLAAEDQADTLKRLESRSADSDAAVRLRLETAAREFERLDRFDYLVINRRNALQEAVDTICAILKAEHARVSRQKEES